MLDSNIGAKERERCLDCMVQQIFISFSPKKDAAYRPKSNSPMLKSKQYLTFIHFKIAYSLPIRLLAHRTAITVISCVNIVVHFVCIQLREKKNHRKTSTKISRDDCYCAVRKTLHTDYFTHEKILFGTAKRRIKEKKSHKICQCALQPTHILHSIFRAYQIQKPEKRSEVETFCCCCHLDEYRITCGFFATDLIYLHNAAHSRYKYTSKCMSNKKILLIPM